MSENTSAYKFYRVRSGKLGLFLFIFIQNFEFLLESMQKNVPISIELLVMIHMETDNWVQNGSLAGRKKKKRDQV